MLLSLLVGTGVIMLIITRPREVRMTVGPSWTPAPEKPAEPAAPPAAPSAAHNGQTPATKPLNINTATAEQLAVLPGIGTVLAERIVALRTERGGAFASVDDLDEVSGIGQHLIDSLRPYIAVSD
jgi:competence protein ComEA